MKWLLGCVVLCNGCVVCMYSYVRICFLIVLELRGDVLKIRFVLLLGMVNIMFYYCCIIFSYEFYCLNNKIVLGGC